MMKADAITTRKSLDLKQQSLTSKDKFLPQAAGGYYFHQGDKVTQSERASPETLFRHNPMVVAKSSQQKLQSISTGNVSFITTYSGQQNTAYQK